MKFYKEDIISVDGKRYTCLVADSETAIFTVSMENGKPHNLRNGNFISVKNDGRGGINYTFEEPSKLRKLEQRMPIFMQIRPDGTEEKKITKNILSSLDHLAVDDVRPIVGWATSLLYNHIRDQVKKAEGYDDSDVKLHFFKEKCGETIVSATHKPTGISVKAEDIKSCHDTPITAERITKALNDKVKMFTT